MVEKMDNEGLYVRVLENLIRQAHRDVAAARKARAVRAVTSPRMWDYQALAVQAVDHLIVEAMGNYSDESWTLDIMGPSEWGVRVGAPERAYELGWYSAEWPEKSVLKAASLLRQELHHLDEDRHVMQAYNRVMTEGEED